MSSIEVKEYNIHDLEKFAEEVCNEYDLADKYFGNLTISLIEVIEFLKKQDHELISIHLLSEEKLSIKICSEKQIDIDFLNLEEADIVNEGLFSVKRLTDQQELSTDKKELILRFNLNQDLINRSLERERKLERYLTPHQKIQEKKI